MATVPQPFTLTQNSKTQTLDPKLNPAPIPINLYLRPKPSTPTYTLNLQLSSYPMVSFKPKLNPAPNPLSPLPFLEGQGTYMMKVESSVLSRIYNSGFSCLGGDVAMTEKGATALVRVLSYGLGFEGQGDLVTI